MLIMAYDAVIVLLQILLVLLPTSRCQTAGLSDSQGIKFKPDEAAALQALHQQLTLCGARVDGVVAADPCATDWIVCTSRALPLNPANLTAGTFAIVLPNSDLSCNLAQLAASLLSLTQLSRLNISYNQLSGVLPAGWSQLTNLEGFSVAGNNISGPLPDQYSSLTKLAVLDLRRNYITGPLPVSWSALVSLKSVILTNNLLGSGGYSELPASWSELTELEVFHLSNNNLAGAVPGAYGALIKLQSLRMDGNNLFGGLIPELSAISTLRELHFQNNNIQGVLPSDLGGLTSLQELLLYNNSIIFGLPDTWSSMVSLRVFDAHKNFLAGKLPQNWWAMSSLRYLDLSYNNFTGTLPAVWARFSSLAELRLTSNQLNGSLPAAWGSFPQLNDLHLASNQFAGALPVAWSRLQTLANLDMSGNILSRALPASWSSLQLTALNASNNRLTQQLPRSWADMPALLSLDLENNLLTGSLPISWRAFHAGLKVLHLGGNKFSNNTDGEMIPRQWYSGSWREGADGPQSLWHTLNSLSLASWKLSLSLTNLTLADIITEAPVVTTAGFAASNCSAPRPATKPNPATTSTAFITIISKEASVEISGWQFNNCRRPVMLIAVNAFSLANISATGNQGPVVELLAGTGSVAGSSFTANRAVAGAAIAVRPGACLQSLVNSRFVRNQGQLLGGALFLGSKDTLVGSGCSTSIQGTVFQNNSAGRDGGAVFTAEPDLKLLKCQFQGNQAEDQGGAVAMLDSSNVTLSGCSLINNSAQYGGAIAVIPSPAQLTRPLSTRQGVLLLANSNQAGNAARPAGAGIGGDVIYAVNMSHVLFIGCAVNTSKPVLVDGGLAAALDSLSAEDRTACLSGSSTSASSSSLVSGIPQSITTTGGFSLTVFCNTSFNLRLQALDGLNQPIMSLPEGSLLTAELEAVQPETTVTGPTSVLLHNGMLTFYDLSVCSLAASRVNVQVTAVFFTHNAEEIPLSNLTVHLQTLGCPAGAVSQPGGCAFCAQGSFSFNSENTACDACPGGAWCEGRTVLPLTNYWQSHPQSPQVHRCMVPQVCNTGKDVYQQLVTLQEQYQQYSRGGGISQRADPTTLTSTGGTSNIGGRSEVVSAIPAADPANSTTPLTYANQLLEKYRSEQCAVGYEGVLCGSCRAGYGHDAWNKCVECDAAAWQVWAGFAASFLPNMLLISGVCALLVRVLDAKGTIPETATTSGASQHQEADTKLDALAVIMLTVTHLQLVSLLPGIHVPWPSAARQMFYVLGQLVAVSQGFGAPLECGVKATSTSLPEAMIVKIVNIFTPAAAVVPALAAAFTVQLIAQLRGTGSGSVVAASTTACGTVLLVFLFYYVELASTLMSLMNCIRVDRVPAHAAHGAFLGAVGLYWVPDTALECGAVNWGIGVPGVVFCVLVAPLLLLLARRYNPRSCVTSAAVNVMNTLLFLPYRSAGSGHGPTLLLVKAMAVASVTYPVAPAAKLAALSIVLLAYCATLLWQWPYRAPAVNHAGAASLCVLAVSVLAIQVSNVSPAGTRFQTAIYSLLALTHVIVLLALGALATVCMIGISTLHKSRVFSTWQPMKSAVQRISASFTSTSTPPTGQQPSTPPTTGSLYTDGSRGAPAQTQEPASEKQQAPPRGRVSVESARVPAPVLPTSARPSGIGLAGSSLSQVGLLSEEHNMTQPVSSSTEELGQQVFKPRGKLTLRGRTGGGNTWAKKARDPSDMQQDVSNPTDQNLYQPAGQGPLVVGEYELATLVPGQTAARTGRPLRVKLSEPDMAVFTQLPSPSSLGKRKSETQEVEPMPFADEGPEDLDDTMDSTMLKWPETIFGGGSEPRRHSITSGDCNMDPAGSSSCKRREPQPADWARVGAALQEQGQLVLKARAPTRGKSTEKLQETKSEP